MAFPSFSFANYIRPVDKRQEYNPLYGTISIREGTIYDGKTKRSARDGLY